MYFSICNTFSLYLLLLNFLIRIRPYTHDNSTQAGNGKGSNAYLHYGYIDKNGPTITSATANSNKTITVKASDNGGSGIDAYILTTSNVAPRADDSNWARDQATQWTTPTNSPKLPGTYYAWAKDVLGNITQTSKSATIKFPGNPDSNGYFQENSTVDGGPASSNNPTIPTGFKPLEDATTKNAHWKDENGHPSAASVQSGLVVEAGDGCEFVWIPVTDLTSLVRCDKQTDMDGRCTLDLDQKGVPICLKHNSYNLVTRLFNDGNGILDFDPDEGLGTYSDFWRQEPFYGTPTKNSDRFSADLQAQFWGYDEKAAYIRSIGSIIEYGGFYMGRYPMTGGTYTAPGMVKGNEFCVSKSWLEISRFARRHLGWNEDFHKDQMIDGGLMYTFMYEAYFMFLKNGGVSYYGTDRIIDIDGTSVEVNNTGKARRYG